MNSAPGIPFTIPKPGENPLRDDEMDVDPEHVPFGQFPKGSKSPKKPRGGNNNGNRGGRNNGNVNNNNNNGGGNNQNYNNGNGGSRNGYNNGGRNGGRRGGRNRGEGGRNY